MDAFSRASASNRETNQQIDSPFFYWSIKMDSPFVYWSIASPFKKGMQIPALILGYPSQNQ